MPTNFIGTIVLFGLMSCLILMIAFLMNVPQASIAYGDKKRTLKRMKKQIDSAEKKIPAPVKGANDGVHCGYCGSIYPENALKCATCGATVIPPTDPTTIRTSSEIRQAILKRDALLALEAKTQTELLDAQEIKHNRLVRFWIVAGILYSLTLAFCILEWLDIIR